MKECLILLLTISMALISCNSQDTYEEWVKKELNKGIQRDSLFLGYRFGMTKQEFYDHSWSLNKEKKVMQGAGNQTVRYEVDELDHKAEMNFYPKFHNNRIYIMPAKYSYSAWAPWNKELWADSLLTDLVGLYEEKYDTGFRKIDHPDLKRPAHVSIQGNRSITIFKKDDTQHVVVTFTDLEVRKQIRDSVQHAEN